MSFNHLMIMIWYDYFMTWLIYREDSVENNNIRLTPKQYHYLKHVLRLATHSSATLVIENTVILDVTVSRLVKDTLTFIIKSKRPIPNLSKPSISLIQALPKQDKFSDILKTNTELGVDLFIPLITERVISRPSDKQIQSKMERWKAVLEHASNQSKQHRIPTLTPIMTSSQFEDYSRRHHQGSLKILLWESETTLGLKDVLKTLNYDSLPRSICLLVGPEGGLSPSDVAFFTKQGFISTKLSTGILRTENAALIACSQLLYEFSGTL